MTTTKTRVNLSLADVEIDFLSKIAKRDQMAVAAKARQLILIALETEEDVNLEEVAKKRDVVGAKYLSHGNFWRKALAS